MIWIIFVIFIIILAIILYNCAKIKKTITENYSDFNNPHVNDDIFGIFANDSENNNEDSGTEICNKKDDWDDLYCLLLENEVVYNIGESCDSDTDCVGSGDNVDSCDTACCTDENGDRTCQFLVKGWDGNPYCPMNVAI